MLGHQVALALLLVSGPAGLCLAEESGAFLKIGAGARAIGMGNAFTAVADDSDALHSNPGGLATLQRTEFGATHAVMFLGDTLDSFSLAVPLGAQAAVMKEELSSYDGKPTAVAKYRGSVPRGTLGLGFIRLTQSGQEGRDAGRRPTGEFGASDMAVSLAYGRRFSGGLSGGVSVKSIQSRIADASASSVAMDLGLLCDVGQRWRVGGAMTNLGKGLRFEQEVSPLPMTVSLGAAVRVTGPLLLSLQASHRPNAGKTSFSLGTEYTLLAAVSLRAGYLHQQAADSGAQALLGGMGGGLGLRWGRLSLDYSLTPFGPLGNVQRFSVRARF